MPKVTFTTLTLRERLENDPHKRFTEAERKAAIKTLQGSVNRAYDRSVAAFGKTPTTARVDKLGGKVKNWSSLSSLPYKEQMAEIRRGMRLEAFKTLRPSSYDTYTAHVAMGLSKVKIGEDKEGNPIYSTTDYVYSGYETLTEDEKKAFWDLVKDLKSNPTFMREVWAKSSSSEALREVLFAQRDDTTITAQVIQNRLNNLMTNTTPSKRTKDVVFSIFKDKKDKGEENGNDDNEVEGDSISGS